MTPRWLIVPAAGAGRRMGSECPKQYLCIAERPVLAHTLARLHLAFPEAGLCLCLQADDPYFSAEWVPFADYRRVSGGEERVDSVLNALRAIESEAADDDLVLVHDVARPCVSIDNLLELAREATLSASGALLATPVADTIKRDDAAGRVQSTEDRRGLWQAQTPQGFRYALLRQALEMALGAEGIGASLVTDEASAVEALGLAPRLVAGRRDNIKITHPEDLALAEHILAAQRQSEHIQETTAS
ncbi:2-C-methyl-D-erythritol 4-phosphate cytidylyltransferase [Halomonas huangheensis]|uniref:2-C-methyl-D-erythritol 4-phosphate cytidylyltransferase n=1 Tax=Halomonas huangheensis TaxID=1178482 RepID=W1N5A5_9GAMM|nr:2-C-methyl-D-erythritol 4-phosphate cytidylyltransferase [Halomonas huangheensis]ALM51637.1 2-C-methyl-D-erythritol 4-phosphate cytidylyltransferase [Halomonas huangheensis]ERL50120.1 hypothetical protein BJB45_03065 [Halomonas huangheensis]